MENPVSSNIKGTPDLENYIKELLLKNKRTLILNYEEVIKGIHDKVSHLNGALLRLWSIIEEEEKAALQDFSENNGVCSPVLTVFHYLSYLFCYWAKFLIPPHNFEERALSRHLLMANLK